MGRIVGRYIMPHSPVLVIGDSAARDNAHSTFDAMNRISREIAACKPNVIVVLSPHGPVFRDMIYVPSKEKLSGAIRGTSFFKNKVLKFGNACDLGSLIASKAKERGRYAGSMKRSQLRKFGFDDELDFGVLVPLYFVSQLLPDFKIVPIGVSAGYVEDQYQYGMALRDAIEASPYDVVVVASCELSHKLNPNAVGFNPEASLFDQRIREALLSNHSLNVLCIDSIMREEAGQCGLDTILMLLGTIDRRSYEAEEFSYEHPFGVGMMTAAIREKNTKATAVLGAYKEAQRQIVKAQHEAESPLARLAREAIATYVQKGQKISVPSYVPRDYLDRKAPVYVTLRMDGRSRGMGGSCEPEKGNIAEEVIASALAAAMKDLHYKPVTSAEVEKLVVAVDVLGEFETLQDVSEMDYEHYGLRIVPKMIKGNGIVVPKTVGVKSNDDMLILALKRAGTTPKLPYSAWRFTAEHYE